MIHPLIRANRFPTLSKCQNICELIAPPPFASTCISVDFKRTQGKARATGPVAAKMRILPLLWIN